MDSIFILAAILAVVVILTVIGILSRYRKCKPDEVLVVYGKTGGEKKSAKLYHGGAAFVLPIIQSYDFLAFEKIGKHENYLGKRKNRGLFQSSVGKLINADVNGALNIMRKVVGDSCESIRRIIDRGLLFNPVRITNVFC